MNGAEVMMVRVYLREREHGLRDLLRYLHEESAVRGMTMFRGVLGYGSDHVEHSSALVDLSLDLPVVVEFFDTPARARSIVEHLPPAIDPAHVVWWLAHTGAEPGVD